mgnify:CR=1 FL=1|jgi:hypothetical protein
MSLGAWNMQAEQNLQRLCLALESLVPGDPSSHKSSQVDNEDAPTHRSLQQA